jgi:tetratricopeptide (TPR) repeat protein
MKTRAPNPETYCELGVLHCRIGNFVEAEKCFQQALHLNADCIHGYLGLTMLRQQEGKTAAAIDCYQNVVRLTRGQPDATDAYRQLGMLYVKAGNMKDAVKSLQEAVRVGPQVGPKHDQAREALDAVRELSRIEEGMKTRAPSPEAYCDLGMNYARIGETAEAENCFQQALHIDPRHARAQEFLKQLDAARKKAAEGP